MYHVSEYTQEQWAQYATKLEEYHSGNFNETIAGTLSYGTCRYCEGSQPELQLPAYEMFSVMEEITPIAMEMSELYSRGPDGRTPTRIRLAGELADFIRKEILK